MAEGGTSGTTNRFIIGIFAALFLREKSVVWNKPGTGIFFCAGVVSS